MFYPELSMIVNDLFSIELIEELDVWFASLPKNHKDRITASKVSIKFGIDFNISTILLEECCKIGILKKKYAITCPICEHVLKISNEEKLYEDISSIDFCYNCNEPKLGFSSDNISVLYVLIKNPTNNPDKVKLLAKKYIRDNKSSKDNNPPTLTDYINKCNYNPNSLFYNPTTEELNKLNELLFNLTVPFKTTTEKGNALEELAEYILCLVKVFKVSRAIRTSTNQFDVLIRNKLQIQGSILSMMGTHCIVECKNEKNKPNNTYYHKLISILQNSNCYFGIVFSLLPITSPCNIIAREQFLINRTIVINICSEELSHIIKNNQNFLDVIESKALEIQINPTTNLLETELF